MSNQLDELAMLRAGIMFSQRAGRSPLRKDFREPDKSKWEATLGLTLPTADAAAYAFGSWSQYLQRMGLKANTSAVQNIHAVEAVALMHCQDVYPDMEIVQSEQNAYDAYLTINNRQLRTEIKGASLIARSGGSNQMYLSFATHKRTFSKTVDRVVLVGVGTNPSNGVIEPLVRLEVPQTGLKLLDDKSSVMIYSTAIWNGDISKYSPYIKWRRPMSVAEIRNWARTS